MQNSNEDGFLTRVIQWFGNLVVDWIIPIAIGLLAIYINQSLQQPGGAVVALLLLIFLAVYLILKAPFH